MKNTQQLRWIFFLCLTICLPGLIQAAEWKRVNSEAGYYSILMPGTPKFSTSSTESPVGRIPEEICEYKSKRLDLTAEVSLLPGIAVFFGGQKTIINKASNAYLKHIQGTLISSRRVKSNGYSGKEIQYTATSKDRRPFSGIAHFFLVQKRLYVLVGDTYDRDPDRAAIKKFLKSFKIEGLPKKKPRNLHPIPVGRPGE